MLTHTTNILHALEFIEKHLKDPLTLSDIACVAKLSERHLQRVFRQLTGDSVSAYIRGRRLTLATDNLLKETNKNILEIALDYQFQSQEVFTRAFQALFWKTPGQFRREGIAHAPQFKYQIGDRQLAYLFSGITTEPQFVNLPALQLVGVSRRLRSYSLPSDLRNLWHMQQMFDGLNERKSELRHIFQLASPELPVDTSWSIHRIPANPQYVDEIEVFCGVTVDAYRKVPSDLQVLSLPSQNYATFTHQGSIEHIRYAISYCNSVWLPRSGIQLQQTPLLTQQHSYDPDTDSGCITLFIPINK